MIPPDDLVRKFADDYYDSLQNRSVNHSRIMLTFSGIPGSGKTTLARRPAKDLKAQYVQHDQIRQLITEAGYEPKDFPIRDISHAVIDTIMTDDNNKFVILDASIDRTWPVFFSHVQEWDIKPIVIRLNVPYDVLKKRLIKRDGMQKHTSRNINLFIEQFENCKARVVVDFELGVDYDYDSLLRQITTMIV